MRACSGPYGDTHASRLLNGVRESASAMEAGNWFHSGIVRNTVEFQSGDDFHVALGRSSLSGLETPLGVLFGWMLTDPCNILYNRIIRWSRRRSANGCHFRSFRSHAPNERPSSVPFGWSQSPCWEWGPKCWNNIPAVTWSGRWKRSPGTYMGYHRDCV